MTPPRSISARNSSVCCSSMTRMTTVRFSSRWRSWKTIWSSRADLESRGRRSTASLFRAVQLFGQAVHCVGDLAPLRKPDPGKTKRQVGSLDPALAETHAGGCAVAGTASGEIGRVAVKQVFAVIGCIVAKGAHRQAVLPDDGSLLEVARKDRAGPNIRRERIVMCGDGKKNPVDRPHLFVHAGGTDAF